ncbi:tetratricopeptide repeat protein [Winogradskyella vidalii]|uniref:tetratricopeptide repeat protein n=1 Tax=Winogradskyella vidalii TaxID=2615024 RepID=UPI0015CB27DF|nr:tetratricopeptide repeat protein [Winogradskyella vidalii]
MRTKQIYLSLLFGLIICVWRSAADDLHKKDIDSLLTAYTTIVYEDPQTGIDFGLAVYNDTSQPVQTTIKALMLVSLAYTSQRDYQNALDYTLKAIDLSEQVDNNPLLKINILLRSGVLYQQLKIFDKSIEVLDKAQQLCLAYPNQKEVATELGNIYLVKGFIYKDNLNCDIALSFFDKGIAQYVDREGYRGNMSIAYYNKGNCYTLLSQYGNAKNSFYKAIELAKLYKANSLISFGQKGLAEVYTLEGRYQEAIDLLQIALEQSRSVGDVILEQGIYKGLFENYLALNQWEDYQKNYDLFLNTQLVIKESERNSVSNSIDKSFQSNSEELKTIKSNFSDYLTLTIIIVVFISIGVIFFELKNRKTIKSLQNSVKMIQDHKQNQN